MSELFCTHFQYLRYDVQIVKRSFLLINGFLPAPPANATGKAGAAAELSLASAPLGRASEVVPTVDDSYRDAV